MKPKKQERTPCDDFFRMRLEEMLDHRHELYGLAGEIEWSAVEERFGDLHSEEGRPGIPIRLMMGLHYLKHTFDKSDEAVVNCWVENPYWQYFCGEEYFRHQLPIDPSQMTRFRDRIGAEGCEYMLNLTVVAGVATQTVAKQSLSEVIVDTTVQEKAIAFPTDAKLYDKARNALVKHAKQVGIVLRQRTRTDDERPLHMHGKCGVQGENRSGSRLTWGE